MGVVSVLLVVASGCSGSRCESVCESANACDLTKRPADVDCPEYCADVTLMQDRMKKGSMSPCSAEFDAHLKCWEQTESSI
jgi:hypothetical protein